MRELGGPLAVTAELVDRRPLVGEVHVLEFVLDGATAAPTAGQFYQVECGGGKEHLLRRPLSVLAFESGATAQLSFLVEAVGWGTRRLCSMNAGDEVSLLGPLGNGFASPGKGRALLLAGGIGIAPLVFLARELESERCEYDLVAGFRDASQYYPGLEELESEACVLTEDGSRGSEGKACDGLAERLGRSEYSAVYACGPEAMLSVAAGTCERAGVPCQVSLDSRMACGLGACRGCVKEGTGGKNLCVCLDGPVFDSREVAWKE